MGLVIVVILVSLGMLFLLKFVVFQPTGEERMAFTQRELVTFSLTTLMSTTTTCDDLSMSFLIKDCAAYKSADCDGEGSCQFVNRTIETLLGKTLKIWQKNYLLKIYLPGQQPLVSVKNGACLGSKTSDTRFLPSDVGLVYIQLEVCDEQ